MFNDHIRDTYPQMVSFHFYILEIQNAIYLPDRSILYLKVRHLVTQEFKLRHAKRICKGNIKKDDIIREDLEFIEKVF